jgi:hypothetical protein
MKFVEIESNLIYLVYTMLVSNVISFLNPFTRTSFFYPDLLTFLVHYFFSTDTKTMCPYR